MSHLTSDRGTERQWCAGRAQNKAGLPQIPAHPFRSLRQRDENRRGRSYVQTPLLRLVDHADDATHRRIKAGVQLLAERFNVGEVPAHKCFIDDDDGFSADRVVLIELSALAHGHLHHSEIVG